MKTLEEILALEDVERKIYYLKKGRKTQLPDREKLYADWDPNKHEIFDKEKYPQIEITIEQEKEEYDEKAGKKVTIPKKTKKVDPNRIALPLE